MEIREKNNIGEVVVETKDREAAYKRVETYYKKMDEMKKHRKEKREK